MSHGSIYDELDSLFRGIWGLSLHHGLWLKGDENNEDALRNLTDLIVSALPAKGTFADIGCGYGTFAHSLVANRDCRVIASTNSHKQADQFTPHPSLEILAGNWLDQTIPAESLDAAIAIESLSHFPSFDDFLAHTQPALKPGARLIIADWFSDHGEAPLLRHLSSTGNLPNWRSRTSFVSLAEKNGLTPVRSINLSRQAAPTWSKLYKRALTLPFRNPTLIPRLLSMALRYPSLLWSFPLLRLVYETGDLQYHFLCFQK